MMTVAKLGEGHRKRESARARERERELERGREGGREGEKDGLLLTRMEHGLGLDLEHVHAEWEEKD